MDAMTVTTNRFCYISSHVQVFVSSGLGGMSGAQAKAAVICGCIGVIAEVGSVNSAL